MKSFGVSTKFPLSVVETAQKLVDPQLWSQYGGTVSCSGDAAQGWVLSATTPVQKSQLPQKFAGFVPATVEIEQVLNLGPVQDSSSGTFNASVQGAPVKVQAQILIRPDADEPAQTVVDIDGQVDSSVPFVGSAIENAAAPKIESMLGNKLEQLRNL